MADMMPPSQAPYYNDSTITLYAGDCLDVLRSLPDASVDAVVTDPPYGLANTDPAHVAETITRWVNGERDYLPGGAGFMGKAWDAFVPPVAVWDECLRVLKPGGHVLAFAGSRTVDLMTLGLRLAGFDIRDSVAWLYGSGFPKSLDVSKAITATQTLGGSSRIHNRRAMTGDESRSTSLGSGPQTATTTATSKAPPVANLTPDAERWQGWGTALKPAFEPVVVARKPLAGTVAANVLAHGTGALNIDGCRVEGGARPLIEADYKPTENSAYEGRMDGSLQGGSKRGGETTQGRWPANVVLDEAMAEVLDAQSGERPGAVSNGSKTPEGMNGTSTFKIHEREQVPGRGDSGGASRFFYVAKADASERVRVDGIAHPTVKPLSLMRWLVRLVTPPDGTVLEPFAGSGTTVEACILEGFRCVAIEREADYLPLIVQRINRRRDPVEAVKGAGVDAGLFDLLDGGAA